MTVVAFPSVEAERDQVRSHKPDTFTRDMFIWLEQVQADHELSHTAFRVAFVLSRHMNRKLQGDAWPTEETIAERVGLKVRATRTALAQLKRRGHLKVTHRYNDSNLYRWVIKAKSDRHETAAAPDEPQARNCLIPRHQTAGTPGTKLPPNHLNEPSEETSDRFARTRSVEKKRSKRNNQMPQQIPWPEDLKLTGENLTYAMSQGYRHDQAIDMWKHFQKHSKAKGHTNANWHLAWQLWVDRQAGFLKQHSQTSMMDGRL